jgi:PAS domain S-box-containing protein
MLPWESLIAVALAPLGGVLGYFAAKRRHARSLLTQAEGGYRALLERVPAIVYTAEYGADGHWSYVSPRIEPILGFTPQEWIERPTAWYERIHPDDREQALAAEHRSHVTGEPLDSEYRMFAKDGRVLWFRDQATVVNDEHGRPVVMQGVMLDITSRKRAEDELELRYAVQKRLAEAASLNEGLHGVLRTVAARFGFQAGGFWVADDHEERLKLADMWYAEGSHGEELERASRALLLAPGEGLPGRAWSDGEPVWVDELDGNANFPRAAAAEACGLHTGIACPVVSGNQVRGVLEFFAAERRPSDPEVISLLSAVGALIADFVATRSVIEEHRTRLQAVLDNAPAIVYAKDGQGRFLFVNRRFEEVLAVSGEAIMGKTDYDLMPVEVADRLKANDRLVFETGRQIEVEEEVPLEDAARTYLSVKFPLRDSTGSIYAVCGISTDMTELKRAQQELDQREEIARANQAKSAFLSRVSHELRTPLNAILGFGQVLEVDSLTERQHNSVQQIMKGGRHLLGLVNDLLEISRVESGELKVSLGLVDVANAVNDIVLMIEPLAAERSVSIAHRADDGIPLALADEQRVKQVVLNLVSNAIKYNRDGGTVDVHLTQQRTPGRVAVRITDTGHGIAADGLDRLFSPFERLGAEQGTVEGTGLGLALSKLMVEAMDGTLTVTSTPGAGSTFTVELPAMPTLSGERAGEGNGKAPAPSSR